MKKILYLPVIITTMAKAQDKELLRTRYTYIPSGTADKSVDIKSFDLAAGFPVLSDSSSSLIIAPTFRSAWLNGFPDNYSQNLIGGRLNLVYSTRWDEKHRLDLLLTGLAFADNQSFGFNDLRYSLGFRYKTRVNEHFSYAFGLNYTRQYSGGLLFPFLEMDYRFSPKLRLFGPFPANTRVEYTLSHQTYLGVGINTDVYNYNTLREGSRYVINQSIMNSLVYLKQKLFGNFYGFTNVGFAIQNKTEIYDQQALDAYDKPFTFPLGLGGRPQAASSFNRHSLNFQAGLSCNLP
ncbi:MAG: hypothetical protein EOO88_06445 [Pedobacter sp.]|nr:MAG: hypothetical protein EOO88_06445 [Pedobacter sp.]